jgi:Mg2+-importing ATPase
LVLIAIAIVSFVVNKSSAERYASSGIILAILLITCFTKIYQELRSSKASQKLREMIKTTAAVERNGIKNETPIEEIVPGDIIHLAAGDMVPADLLIINAKDLFVTQSALTGESEPVEKIANWSGQKFQSALESNNLCFMGTSVSSGSAQGVVLNIGSNTFFGQIARSITKRRPKTSFDKGIRAVSMLLLCTTLIMTLLIFVLNISILHQ